jgi:site-specific DNA-methyltransferase (adenine-specific)
VLARKPLAGTVAGNVIEHGTGALNVDGCRVEHGTDVDLSHMQRQSAATAGMNGLGDSGFHADHQQPTYNSVGRWPPNVLLTHSADCDGECAEGCPVAGLDAQTGTLTSGKPTARQASGADRAGNTSAAYNAESHPAGGQMVGYGDTGGASRFFPQLNWSPEYDLPFMYQAKAGKKERPRLPDGTAHSTVKPLALMRWLARLVTPPGGVLIDPFCGTGTTLQAARLEGFRAIGCDDWDQAIDMARKRLGLDDQEPADAG